MKPEPRTTSAQEAHSGSAAGKPPHSDRLEALNNGLVLTVLTAAALRILIANQPHLTGPLQQLDPGLPTVELGPEILTAFNGLAVLLLGLVLAVRWWKCEPVHGVLVSLWAAGALLSAWFGRQEAESLNTISHWTGALALGLAALHLGRSEHRRQWLLAGCIAVLPMLGTQAMYQVFVLHPQTIEEYFKHRDEIAAERGWEPGGSNQKKYEQRLMQTEATGRTGLSNVFGSVSGALVLLAAGGAWYRWRSRNKPEEPGSSTDGDLSPRLIALTNFLRRRSCTLVLLGTAVTAGSAGLFFSGSKGAIGGFLIAAVAAGGLSRLAQHRPAFHKAWWLLMSLGPAAIIALVLLRGAMGLPDSVDGERSLLFRWQYWQGAAAVWQADPVQGSRPALFQEHFSRLKPPYCPEDVSDPHNLAASWLSMLGIGGALWILMLALWMGLLARSLATAPQKPPLATVLPTSRAWALSTAFGVLFLLQYLIEIWRYSPPEALLWAAATLAGTGLVLTSLLGTWRVPPAAAGAAALFILMHCQVEMTLVHPASASLLFLILGTAASQSDDTNMSSDRQTPRLLALAFPVLAIAWGLGTTLPLLKAESHVRLTQQALQLNRPAEAASALHAAWQLPVPLRAAALEEARLLAAAGRLPEALKQIEAAQGKFGPSSALSHAEAQICDRLAAEKSDPALLLRAAEAAETAARLDPHNPHGYLAAADRWWSMRERDRAAGMYNMALEANIRIFLDPLRQLDEPAAIRAHARLQPAAAGPKP